MLYVNQYIKWIKEKSIIQQPKYIFYQLLTYKIKTIFSDIELAKKLIH